MNQQTLAEPKGTIYTIGYQGHSTLEFLSLLTDHGVTLLVDVRTVPFSKFRDFNRAPLEQKFGSKYHWEGDRLGGKKGHREVFYNEGLAWLAKQALKQTVCIMCMENDADKCHRKKWIGADLEKMYGFRVVHL